MIDPATQSAINTLRNWSERRLARGKPVTRDLILARIRELWTDVTADNAEQITDGVLS